MTENNEIPVHVTDTTIRNYWEEYYQFIHEEIFKASTQPPGEQVLEIDYFDLAKHSHEGVLSDLFREEPDRTYLIGQKALDEWDTGQAELLLSIKNVGEAHRIPVERARLVQPHTVVEFQGMVQNVGDKDQRTHFDVLNCSVCDDTVRIQQEFSLKGDKVEKVKRCPSCDTKGSMNRQQGLSVIEPYVRVSVVPVAGADNTNTDIPVLLRRSQVGQVQGGDEVTVTGYRLMEQRGKKNSYIPYVLGTHVELSEDRDFDDEASSEDVQRWKQMVGNGDALDAVMDAVFPYFHGHEAGRKALILSLFSSPRKNGTRGDINMLMVGDPGTGKSQLTRRLDKVTPRSVLVNGNTSTEAGLTCAAVRDNITGQYALRAGALPLASGGVCLIDEIDKADKAQQEALLEALEEQTISVNKAGFSTYLTAQCSVIAAGNPTYGRWDDNQPLAEQIDLLSPLISRFDAILLFRDKPNPERDQALASAVLNRRQQNHEPMYEFLDEEYIRRMVWFCRENVTVSWKEEALDEVNEAFMELRGTGSHFIGARQMESMTRFAEARARFHLRNEVGIEDAQWAIQFVTNWVEKIARGFGGGIDIDYIEDPEKASQKDLAGMLRRALDELWANQPADTDKPGVPLDALLERLEREGFTDKHRALDLLSMMKDNGELLEPAHDYYQPIN